MFEVRNQPIVSLADVVYSRNSFAGCLFKTSLIKLLREMNRSNANILLTVSKPFFDNSGSEDFIASIDSFQASFFSFLKAGMYFI